MEKMTRMPFQLPGAIFRSPCPSSIMFDLTGEVFPLYKMHHINWVVMLLSDEEALQHSGLKLREVYASEGYQVIYAPVKDFCAPPFGAFDDAIQQVLAHVNLAENVVIHCHAGIGRTGMFLACMARELWGWDADEARGWVRQFIPFAIESDVQMDFVREYKITG